MNLLKCVMRVCDLKLGFLAWTGVQAVLAAASLWAGLKLHRERPEARSGPALIYLGAMFYLGAIGLGGYTLEIWNRFNSPWYRLDSRRQHSRLVAGCLRVLGALEEDM